MVLRIGALVEADDPRALAGRERVGIRGAIRLDARDIFALPSVPSISGASATPLFGTNSMIRYCVSDARNAATLISGTLFEIARW